MNFPKPFIVAEIGASHNGSYSNAIRLIEAAHEAGADAVKFQTYLPEEIAVDVPIVSGPWAGRSYHDLYSEAAMPWVWYETLFGHARKLGLVPFATPFSEAAVKRLETVYCPIFKIASSEITHLRLIAAAAKTGKPLIISTGMASLAEILAARKVAKDNGATQITFLHCIAAYPAQPEDFNLNNLVFMKHAGLNIGLSDHSPGWVTAVAAVAMGAMVIEKHLVLDRANGGPDAAFSLNPHEFESLVWACRTAYAALGGKPMFGVHPAEKDSEQYRRSIWVVKPMKAGQVITESDVAILRPNYGLPPAEWDKIIGIPVTQDIEAVTPLGLEHFR
jgi:N-acetylneuraminate synthase